MIFKAGFLRDLQSGKKGAKDILKIENIEARMLLLALYKPERLLKELDAKKIDENERGDCLYIIDKNVLGTSKDVKIGKYKDYSTDRVYIDFMNPEAKTIDEALAMRHKFTLKEWKECEHA